VILVVATAERLHNNQAVMMNDWLFEVIEALKYSCVGNEKTLHAWQEL